MEDTKHENLSPEERAFREGFRMGEQYGSAVQCSYGWGKTAVNEPDEGEAWRDFCSAKVEGQP